MGLGLFDLGQGDLVPVFIFLMILTGLLPLLQGDLMLTKFLMGTG